MTPIRISAKRLASLAAPDFCPRCFWLKSKCQFKLPYQIFPGIFSSIDSYSKKVTNHYFEKYGHLPRWITGAGIVGTPIKVPHHSRLFCIDEETNITLTGMADEIIKQDDGSYAIIDYKTAKYTNGQDASLPVYQVQLNGYAYIAEKIGISPVSAISLVYYEPQTDLTPDDVEPGLPSWTLANEHRWPPARILPSAPPQQRLLFIF